MTPRRLINILTKEFPLYYVARVFNILPNHGVTCSIRGFWIKYFFKKHGNSFALAQSSIISYPENIEVGDNVYFAHRIYVNASRGLLVGNDVTIGPNCIIATGNHDVQNGKVVNEGSGGKIIINDGTWIGGNVTITGGVTIGHGCIIGAGSVITNDIPDHVLAGGVPARIIKKIDDGEMV